MGKIRNAFRNILYGAILAGGLTLAGCAFNRSKVPIQESPKAVYCLTEEKPKENKLEKVVKEKVVKEKEEDPFEGLRDIPKVGLDFKLNLSNIFDPHANTENNLSFSRMSLKGVDVLLNKSGCDNMLTRMVKMLAVDYTLAYFFTSYNHELGHTFRADEAGIPSEIVMYVRNKMINLNKNDMPFTTVKFSKKYPIGCPATDQYPIDGLMIYLGGIESDVIKHNKLAEDMMKSDMQNYYDAIMYATGKGIHVGAFGNGERPYIKDNFSKEEYEKWEEEWGGDDIYNYMMFMNYLGVRVSPSNIKSGGLWNMLDSFLAMSFFVHPVMHFGEGVRQIPNPRYMIATNYILAPYGPEVAINFYHRNKDNIVAKISGRKSIGQSYGLGFKLMNLPLKTKISDRVNLGVGVWKQDFPEALERYQGTGMGIEVEAEKDIGKDTSLNFGLRAKTKGYNLGDSLKENIQLYLGVSKKW